MLIANIALLILLGTLQVMNMRHTSKKDAEIKDLNERLIARNHVEYQTNTQQVPVEPKIDYTKPLSYWDATKPLETD